MARGERRSLVTIDLGSGGPELEARVTAEAVACAPAVERLFGKRAPAPWFALPFATRDTELDEIRDVAAELRANSDVVLILASEGTESSARAVIEALGPALAEGGPRVEFVLARWAAPHRLAELLAWLGDRRISLVVLGDHRLGPWAAACLRVLQAHVLHRHGEAETRRRIVVAATQDDGALGGYADQAGVRLLAPPTAVPSRYSTLTPAGLLPAALGGVDPLRLVEGARSQARSMEGAEPTSLAAVQYALARLLLAEEGRSVEWLAVPDPTLGAVAEEWERLLAVAPAGLRRAPAPRALRLPEGPALRQPASDSAFATALYFPMPPGPDVGDGPDDGWSSVARGPFGDFAARHAEAVRLGWSEDGVPGLTIRLPRLDTFHLGAFLQFLHCTRGLTAVLHAPDADMKKMSPAERVLSEGGLRPDPSAQPATGAV